MPPSRLKPTQWVLPVRRRLLLRVIEAWLHQRSHRAGGRLGAVTFLQRFGSALNAHVHFHCCIIDGVFALGADGQVYFAEAPALIPASIAAGSGRCGSSIAADLSQQSKPRRQCEKATEYCSTPNPWFFGMPCGGEKGIA
jgi:hypothetical protein